jgi:hypothetical protein
MGGSRVRPLPLGFGPSAYVVDRGLGDLGNEMAVVGDGSGA